MRRSNSGLWRADGVVLHPTLAVDLGTFGSTAILVTSERDINIEDPYVGHPVWSSTVAHDGVCVRVGGAADSYARINPDQAQKRLKQLLAEPTTIPIGDVSYRPAQLAGWLFAGIREQGERVSGTEVNRGVFTLPVGQGVDDLRREALLDAAAIAGFTSVELLYEPLATVAAPITDGALAAGDIAMVADFGASSTTATLVSLGNSGPAQVLGYVERPDFSGQEIDRLVMSELLSRSGRTWSDLIRPGGDPAQQIRNLRVRRVLEDTARTMKHQLSAHPKAIELVGPEEVPVELTDSELVALVAPALHRTVASFREVLIASGVRERELAAVVLSGGGSRLPVVAEVVVEIINRPVRVAQDQSRAVVEGAARFARAAEHRYLRARVATDRETPLRWDVPGDHGSDLRWLLAEGDRFSAGEALAEIRLDDGSLWELRPGRSGTLIRTHVANGAPIGTGDWLVTVELDVRPFR